MVPQTETPRSSRVKMAIWSTMEHKGAQGACSHDLPGKEK